MIRRRYGRFYRGMFWDILKYLVLEKDSKADYIKSFEEEFAKYIGVKHAIATCTGRNGLELILEALDLKEGDEVIFPAFTLKDLVLLVQRLKLKPVLVDIEANSFNINAELIEEKITERTKAIIATHLFGLPCNIEKIAAIADKRNIKVIEDCAHSCGAEYKGRKCGSLGWAAFFSFELTKALNTFGGGAITTDDRGIADYIAQKLRDYPAGDKKVINKIIFSYAEHLLIRTPLFIFFSFLFCFPLSAKIMSKLYFCFHRKLAVGHSRFTSLQAYLGIGQLRRLDEQNTIRFEKSRLLRSLLNERLSFQTDSIVSKRFYYFFVVRIRDNFSIENMRKRLFFKGVDTGIRSEITDDCSLLTGGRFPVTESVYNSLLQLPMYDSITIKEIKKISRAISNIL